MWWFLSPRIVFGQDALKNLPGEMNKLRPGKKAFIVTDKMMSQLGTVERVKKALPGWSVEVFDEVEPEPSIQTIQRGAERVRAFAPEWLIGLGGGSCMDASKAMWVLYENPSIAPDAINPFQRLGLRQKARLCAIPTTSGTGSEVTWAMILTDTTARRKVAMSSHEAIPDLAVVDPVMAATMPPRVTSDTGLDAITHATEGYVTKWRNDYTNPLCLQGVKLGMEYLPRAFDNGEDMVAREKMANCATIAGLGFGNSQVGIAHSMGHAMGALFKVPHGRSVGLWLPYSIEFNAKEDAVANLYGEIAWFLGLGSGRAGMKAYVAKLREMYKKLGQPLALKELVPAEKVQADLDKLVNYSRNDPCTVTNPRNPSAADFKRIVEYALDGKPIDF